MKKNPKYISAFKTYYCPWRYPSNWIKNIKSFLYNFKYAYQRIIRGYSDYDIWDLDSYFTNTISNAMEDFVELNKSGLSGYPAHLNNCDEWHKKILAAAHHLYMANSENDEYEKRREEWFDEDTMKVKPEINIIEQEKEINQEAQDHLHKAFEFFEEYGGWLWI